MVCNLVFWYAHTRVHFKLSGALLSSQCYYVTGSDHSLHTPADISTLLVYSQDWTTEWWSIGIKLGLPAQRLEEIRIDQRRVQDCCHQMLLLWSKVDPTNCYCKLVMALDQLKLKKAAKSLAKEYVIF